jgi:hypothetical protein
VIIQFDELPSWVFDVREVSAGVYRATGSDRLGHRTIVEGLDPEACLEECRSAALTIDQNRKAGSGIENHSS